MNYFSFINSKYFCVIFLLIAFAFVALAIFMFNQEQIVFNVNQTNKNAFMKAIEADTIDNKDSITKVTYGLGFHSGELYIYHSNGEMQHHYSLEGNFNYCNLLQYVKEHGYQLDNIGEMFLVISIVTFIIFLILLLKNLLVKN